VRRKNREGKRAKGKTAPPWVNLKKKDREVQPQKSFITEGGGASGRGGPDTENVRPGVRKKERERKLAKMFATVRERGRRN